MKSVIEYLIRVFLPGYHLKRLPTRKPKEVKQPDLPGVEKAEGESEA